MKCIHHNDMDGHSAAAVVRFVTTNTNPQDYFEWDYNSPIPVDTFEENEYVYIVDCSFGESTVKYLEQMMDKNCHISWLDHHKTSIDLQANPKYAWTARLPGIRSTEHSGAYLTWQFFFPNMDVPYIIQLISDFDTFQNNMLPMSSYFKLGAGIENQNPIEGIYYQLLNHTPTDREKMMEKIMEHGAVIKQYVDVDNKKYFDSYAYKTNFLGYQTMVVNKRSGSEVFGDSYGNCPLYCTYVFNGEKYVYSLFSVSEDVDCSALAAKFGGGGHKGAAGFSAENFVLAP